METDFSGLSFMPCAVTRMTEWISTHLLWICFKEKKNCKLLTQFLIISKKAMPKNTLHPSSVVRFTGKLWYLADSLKTLYLKCVMKNTAHEMPGGACAYTQIYLAVQCLCPKTDAVILNGIAMCLCIHVRCI